ncbi:MAG: oligosaccharide flippase family protein [Verrucomicrobia bacterium]|nr:oligosaccharide flippase family protein [Verrucomicrobiota bacterium]
MKKTSINLLANISGKFVNAIISLIATPFYVQYMGIEAYGLVGVFLTFLALSQVLDMGLSVTANREMARMSSKNETAQEMGNFTRTIEIIYWLSACCIGSIILCLAPWISTSWLTAQNLSPEVLKSAIYCMGIALALQWPNSFYAGALTGLQKHILLNSIAIGTALMRAVGLIVILCFFTTDVKFFFLWQAFVNLIQTLISGYFVWYLIPPRTQRSRFDKKILKRIYSFALGMTGISISIIILTSLDKIILSKMLSLTHFGYFTLAWIIVGSLDHIKGPIFTSYFPSYSECIAQKNIESLKKIYHQSSQLMSIAIFSFASILVFFPREVLTIWGISPLAISETQHLVSLLAIGTLFNGLMTLPYALQLAHGWTYFTLIQNSVAIIFLTPLLVGFTPYFGAMTAAWTWVILNIGYFLISVPLMHRRLLSEELKNWYFQDCLQPLASGLGVALLARLLFPQDAGKPAAIAMLTIVFIGVLIASLMGAPNIRQKIIALVRNRVLLKN